MRGTLSVSLEEPSFPRAVYVRDHHRVAAVLTSITVEPRIKASGKRPRRLAEWGSCVGWSIVKIRVQALIRPRCHRQPSIVMVGTQGTNLSTT